MKSYEAFLETIGSFGKYQKFICALMVFSTVPNGYWAMIGVFIQDVPEHHCRIPEIENFAKALNISTNSEQYQSWLNASIPQITMEDGNLGISKCKRYRDIPLTWNGTDVVIGPNINQSVSSCDQGWIYDTFPGQSTMAIEWELVCESAYMHPLALSMYMVGVLIGSIMSGTLADRYGRRPVFLVGTLIQFTSMIALSFSTDIYMYIAIMFLSGLNGMVNYVAAFIIATELSDNAHRAMIGGLEIFGFACGYMILAPAAYLIPDWRWLTRFCGLVGILFIPYYWCIPESPRWLITANRYKEAKKLILKIARVNRKELKENDQLQLESLLLEGKNVETTNKTFEKFNYIDLLRHPSIRKRSLVMFYVWFSNSLVYYCLSLNTSNLRGDKYINCFIAAAVEFPAYIASYFLIERCGRRSFLIGCFALSGVICAMVPFFQKVSVEAMIATAMIGKLGITATFMAIYIYCCELFPTMMRSMSVGASSTCARVGGIIAPYLIFAGQRSSVYLPYIVMGCFGILSSISCLLLPETNKANLPNNLREAIDLDRLSIKVCRYQRENNEENENVTNIEYAQNGTEVY